jgi:hypothetical protein
MIYTADELLEAIKNDELVIPFTYTLEKPIKLPNLKDEITEVKIVREPIAGDLQDLPVEKQRFGDYFRPIAKIIGQTNAFVTAMGFEDLKVLMGVIGYFLGSTQKDNTESGMQ